MRAMTLTAIILLLLCSTSPSSSFLLATAERSHRTLKHQSQAFAYGNRSPFSRFRCPSRLAAAAKCNNHDDCDAEENVDDGEGQQSSSMIEQHVQLIHDQAQLPSQRWPTRPLWVRLREEASTRRNALRQIMTLLTTSSCCTTTVTSSPYIASAAASTIPSMVPQNVRETSWPIGKVAFSLLPLAGTYTRRATVKEILSVEDGIIWTFDQIQGVVNVNVPVRMVVVKVSE